MISDLLWRFAATCSEANVNGDKFCTGLPQAAASGDMLRTIVNIVLGIFAAVAVLIIVIAALNMITAGGDPQKVAKARSSIIYALVGLVVAVSAVAIVNLVLGRV